MAVIVSMEKHKDFVRRRRMLREDRIGENLELLREINRARCKMSRAKPEERETLLREVIRLEELDRARFPKM